VAKGQYEKWQTEDNLIRLEGWARDGLTNEQIAQNMKIRRETLWDWIRKYPNISNALKKGKEVVDYQVENALLKEALKGNVTACIYWLKNRKPDKWREQPKETPAEADIPKFLDDIK